MQLIYNTSEAKLAITAKIEPISVIHRIKSLSSPCLYEKYPIVPAMKYVVSISNRTIARTNVSCFEVKGNSCCKSLSFRKSFFNILIRMNIDKIAMNNNVTSKADLKWPNSKYGSFRKASAPNIEWSKYQGMRIINKIIIKEHHFNILEVSMLFRLTEIGKIKNILKLLKNI